MTAAGATKRPARNHRTRASDPASRWAPASVLVEPVKEPELPVPSPARSRTDTAAIPSAHRSMMVLSDTARHAPARSPPRRARPLPKLLPSIVATAMTHNAAHSTSGRYSTDLKKKVGLKPHSIAAQAPARAPNSVRPRRYEPPSAAAK